MVGAARGLLRGSLCFLMERCLGFVCSGLGAIICFLLSPGSRPSLELGAGTSPACPGSAFPSPEE